MALVHLRMLLNDANKSGYIINIKNIESVVKIENETYQKFRVYLMNGENYNFNQLYYEGKFIYVHTMKQLYSLLAKLDSGEIKDGGET